MKKTLIAIAALAATGAFAQSSVTISGTMDMGLQMASVQATTTAGGNTAGETAKTNSFTQNGSSTSAINIAGTEDMGAGMKAMFFVETNPQLDGSTSTAAGSTAGGLNTGSAGTAFGNGQRFVGLSGGFGSVKFGSPNAAALEHIGMSNPFGTALGGGYSGAFSRTAIAATTATANTATSNAAGFRIIRAEKSMRYDSPSFNGFGVSFNYAFPNQTTTNTAAQLGYQAIGLTYSAGPLNAAYSTSVIKNGGAVAGSLNTTTVLSTNAATSGANGLAAGESYTVNVLAANYTFGAATVYAGYTTNKNSTTALSDSSSTNVAIKYAVSGALSLAGNYVKRSDKNALGANGKLLGLGADYALSKRTSAYARYEKFDNNVGNDATGDSKVYGFGVRHAF
jgi:predicted porin